MLCSGKPVLASSGDGGASIAPVPPGLITLECWPGGAAAAPGVAVAAPQQTSVRRQSRPGAEESLARRRKVDTDALIAVLARDRSREGGKSAGDVLKLPDSCRFESGGLGGWILFKKDSYSCLFSYS
jgi:hypothetical protein